MSHEDVQPYLRIVQDVRDQVRSGKLTAHEKLPSTRELAAEYQVALGTVQRALAELRTAGLIYSHQGRGSYISGSASIADQDPTSRAIAALEEKVAVLAARLDKIEKTSG
ncbi:GntR family transcriptional regulator [Embleya sp. NPDC050493]|uniref:GntR family transcriptional regulator n=1 Tax=Embleya sp. NPDC050493 TaxID=3363989 RepID=UPI0037A55C1B